MAKGSYSPSGVFIAEDFRDNLIIDRYDPVFSDMRASKRKHLQSANSEDAITWNVFRSLRQISSPDWIPSLWKNAFPGLELPQDQTAAVLLWKTVQPPPGLRDSGKEGPSEIDVVIETPSWVWFIEAKYRSDISMRTTKRPERDQILRNLDVGSYYAGVRPFYFALLHADRSPNGLERIKTYQNRAELREALKHRTDGLSNLTAVSCLRWKDLADSLDAAAERAAREDERGYAARAISWLRQRKIVE